MQLLIDERVHCLRITRQILCVVDLLVYVQHKFYSIVLYNVQYSTHPTIAEFDKCACIFFKRFPIAKTMKGRNNSMLTNENAGVEKTRFRQSHIL